MFGSLSQTKASENREKSCLGLYSYPVLMAADILLYKWVSLKSKKLGSWHFNLPFGVL